MRRASRGVGRRPLLSPVLAALLGLATVLAVVCPRAAAARHPKHPAPALARMHPDLAASTIGYGPAAPSTGGRGGFRFANWAAPDPYVLGAVGRRLLVVATRGRKLVLTPFALGSHRRGAVRTASIAGWKLTDAAIAADGHIYALLGRGNPQESTSRTVIEVRRYDQRLRLLGVAKVPGGVDDMGVYDGVGASAPDMTLAGTTLIVHMSRHIFHVAGDWADHHEVNLALEVDTRTMTATDIPDRPYASHSFREYVGTSGSDVLFLDHGDAYPRGVQLGIMPGYLAPDHGRTWNAGFCGPTVGVPTLAWSGELMGIDPSSCWLTPEQREVMTFTVPSADKALDDHDMGSVNFTGLTVNGFATTATRALAVGLSVPNGHRVGGLDSHSPRLMANVYLTSTDTATGDTTLVWLTRRNPRTRRIVEAQPALVPVGDGRFAVLWDELRGKRVAMNYRLVDETGRILARKRWTRHAFAAVAQPVLAGNRLLWVGAASAARGYRVTNSLYGLDVTDPARPALLTR